MDYNNNYQQPQYQPAPQPAYQPAPQRNAGPQPNTLVFGILSLVFSSFIVGIILGAIGRSKGNAYIQQGGTLTGASKVGYILSKVGLILSIIGTVCVVLLVILSIADPSAFRFY